MGEGSQWAQWPHSLEGGSAQGCILILFSTGCWCAYIHSGRAHLSVGALVPDFLQQSVSPPWLCFPPESSVVARNSQCPSDHTVTLGSSYFSWLSLAMSSRMVVLGSSWNNWARTSTQISSNRGLDQCPQGRFLVLIWDLYRAYSDGLHGIY